MPTGSSSNASAPTAASREIYQPVSVTAAVKVPDRAAGGKQKPPPQGSGQKRIALAQEKASALSVWPMCHGRCCVAGLMVLCLLRVAAWLMGNIPGGTAWFIHILSLGADMATVAVTMPLLICCGLGGVRGQCVELGCVGPMMTMVVAMNLVDFCALIGFFVFAAPRPMPAHGKSYFDVLEFVISIWELVLVASCFLNCAVCVSCWRVYRELRAAGLYPPNAKGEVAHSAVSPFEVLCEAEDVALLAECSRTRQQEVQECCHTGRPASKGGYVETVLTDEQELKMDTAEQPASDVDAVEGGLAHPRHGPLSVVARENA